ncbi:glycosyltransferase family 2 protein [Calothrix sp. 336/3]|uniref:glycosyltransferase family 2 protein n=1 Tax=Calothrix sp. 336/3 TaxID=1337936 RepID=UPI0004E42147|nr:glycosyltransferase [Calothrix sp. 336/3]AKG23266.1 glycosyltransferase [Calothrix sp. 336/3]
MSMIENFKVSVCICTRNRPDNLRQALNSLETSTYPYFEIIVSDDSTDEVTAELVKSEYTHVRYLAGPRLGLGANRNNALNAVKGSHVLFIDDDVILGENFLAQALQHLQTYSTKTAVDISKVIVTGPQLNHYEDLIFPHDQDFLGYQRVPYQTGDEIKTVVINSAVFPREVFDKVLFDQKLVYGCDEVDFTTRAVKQGYKITICPEAVNVHLPSEINRDFYQPYHEASRIYVTFKRYFSTETEKIKALLFLLIASVHTAAHSLKTGGIKGFDKLFQTMGLVSNYMSLEYFPERK